MSLKEMLTAALLKRDDEGRTIAYPNGAAGCGYIVSDAATEQKLRTTLLRMIVGAGIYGGVGMQILTTLYGDVPEWTVQGWSIAAAASAAFAIGYRAAVEGSRAEWRRPSSAWELWKPIGELPMPRRAGISGSSW